MLKTMKVKPSLKRMSWMALVLALLMAGVIFSSCYHFFLKPHWDFVPWMIIALYLVSTIGVYILSVTCYFYVIGPKELKVVKFTKVIAYPYDDVIYLDTSKGEKIKTVAFVMKKGHLFYLIADNNHEVYKALLKNCRHLLSKEEVARKFPHLKL